MPFRQTPPPGQSLLELHPRFRHDAEPNGGSLQAWPFRQQRLRHLFRGLQTQVPPWPLHWRWEEHSALLQQVPTGMHWVPHCRVPWGQTHWPLPLHTLPWGQSGVSQQRSVKMQVLAHRFFPRRQTHAPPTHSSSLGQAALVQQLPGGMHPFPHRFWSDGQRQTPRPQTLGAGQSAVVQHWLSGMHPSRQTFVPARQAQAPPRHSWPLLHSALEQQNDVEMHPTPHGFVPGGQTQSPPLHSCPPKQSASAQQSSAGMQPSPHRTWLPLHSTAPAAPPRPRWAAKPASAPPTRPVSTLRRGDFRANERMKSSKRWSSTGNLHGRDAGRPRHVRSSSLLKGATVSTRQTDFGRACPLPRLGDQRRQDQVVARGGRLYLTGMRLM